MMKLILLLLLVPVLGLAQTTSPFTKYGKITAQDLSRKAYSIDSNASAVVLSDIGKSAIEGNSKGWFSLVFKRHRVVHILKKGGYDEADVEIPLYSKGDNEESLERIKAVTYNLENGKVVETKLEKSGIFKEKKSANYVVRKFTFPNVKEGSIIEYEYEVLSDYIDNLDPWVFQGSSPVLWSEYTLSVPQFFSYAFLSHGYQPMYLADKKNKTEQFQVTVNARTTEASERVSFQAGVTDYRWVMKDVPEIRQEHFASAIKNHLASLEFQLASQNDPLTPRSFRTTWPTLAQSLLESEFFGNRLDKDNNWMADEVKPLLAGAGSATEKAKKIFEHVRDQYSCTSNSALYASQPLKQVQKTRKGNVADINLLLVAMLRYAGVEADPVLVSTTDHGYALEHYPMITSFNYVVAAARTGNDIIMLDASQPRLGFGRLMPYCYNGHARLVSDAAPAIYLAPDSLKEKKFVSFLVSNSDEGKWVGSVNRSPGYYESYSIRNKIQEKGAAAYLKEIATAYSSDTKVTGLRIDSLDKLDEPVTIRYDVELEPGNEDILYVNPLFGEGYSRNPFQSAQRYYPVEMPYTIDETFVLSMAVPAGYEVDELPKQMIAKLDADGSGYFEYRITQSESIISLRTIVRFTKSMFLPDEYENLREFFNLIVNKHAESVVFKKKK